MFTESQLSFVTWVILPILSVFAIAAVIYAVGKLLSGIGWLKLSRSVKDPPVAVIPEITEAPNTEFYKYVATHDFTWLIDEDLNNYGSCTVGEDFLQRIDRTAPLIPEEAVEELYDVLLEVYKDCPNITVELFTISVLGSWQIVVKYVMPE